MNLWHIKAVDQHAHNLLRSEAAADLPYPAAFTEGRDPEIFERHARRTLCFLRSLRDISELLDCDATEEAILEKRRSLGLEQLAARCFKAAHLSAVFLDDGFRTSEILPLEWHRQFVSTHRVLRLEYVAEGLIREEPKFGAFRESFHNMIDPPTAEVVALKTIAAYRTGLRINPKSADLARSRFELLRGQASDKPIRLDDKPLIDFLVIESLEIAARHGIPMQFHTGFGDPDLDLRLANPLHLRPLLEEPRWRKAHIVLLHAGYPYVREAAYLASVYPQVYVDFGLAIPFLSVTGMRAVLQELLELAPTTKLMFSSDAHMIPELFYLGAKWGRETLAKVLEGAVENSDLTSVEAEHAAMAIMSGNAQSLYFDRKSSN